MTYIYLANPYTHEDKTVMENRYQDMLQILAKYTKAGITVFSPIVHSHPIADLVGHKWSDWEKVDIDFIKSCDRVHVIMMEGWETSTGVSAEIKIARGLSKPVNYMELDYLDEYLERVYHGI